MTSKASRSSRSRRNLPASASREVGVGGRDEADIDAQRAAAAESFELAVFDDAQDLFLHQSRRGRDFVEEQGAFVRPLEAALVHARSAREGARFVAEQFALEQRIGYRRAVHLQEFRIPPVRQVVQARGDEFLAGSAFADDEHGLVERRHGGDIVQRLEEGGGLADQSIWLARHGGI